MVVAAAALAAHFVPGLPTELVLGLAAAILGIGDAVQRFENAKTEAAYELAPASEDAPVFTSAE